jgi:stage III sporulation protein AE
MKKLFVLPAVLIIFFLNIHVYAGEYTHIEGEELFNRTADEIMSGDFSLNPVELIQKGIDGLFKELKQSRAEMVSLLVIAALSGALQVLKNTGGGGDGVSESAFFACFTLMTISALRIFGITVGYGVSVIDDLSDFVTKLSPVLMVLLVSGGSVTSAAAFHPILSGAVYVMTVLVDKCIIPLVYLSAVMGIVGHITPKLQLTAFTKLIRSAGKWMLTAALTVFTGVTALYGFSAPVLDAVALKTVKFAVGSFVPVVGGILSDTVETVLSGTQLMKNAVGTAGLVSVAAVCIIPILKILAILIMLEICAAAAEPLADKRIMEMLKDIASSISLILGMVITVSMLFMICIGIILGATA